MNGRNFRKLLFGICLCFVAIDCAGPIAADEYRSRYEEAARSRPFVVETANFRVYGISRLPNARAIGRDFEALRTSLCRTWFGDRRLADWSPKCDVMVHATLAGYTHAVGHEQFSSVGSSLVDTMDGKITLRRLDIRADEAGWFAAAVPHELTHVIMADEFLGRELPCWADEGMALLADTAFKQSLHQRDLELGHREGRACRLDQFVRQTSYPVAADIAVFYGQSASLVKHLVERRSPTDFVRFLHLAEKDGYDAALAEVYSLRGVNSLEREWLTAAVTVPASNVLTAAAPQDGHSSTAKSLVAMSTTP